MCPLSNIGIIYTRRGYGLLYDFNRIIAVTLIGLLVCGMFDRGIEYYEIIPCWCFSCNLGYIFIYLLYYGLTVIREVNSEVAIQQSH